MQDQVVGTFVVQGGSHFQVGTFVAQGGSHFQDCELKRIESMQQLNENVYWTISTKIAPCLYNNYVRRIEAVERDQVCISFQNYFIF